MKPTGPQSSNRERLCHDTLPRLISFSLGLVRQFVAFAALAITFLPRANAQTPPPLLARPPERPSLYEMRVKAELGDAAAQVQLGDAYDIGAGVKRDVAKAIKWYRKAAEQGDAEGQYSLGGKYDSGDGVPQDYAEALKWYRKAAEQGHSTAQYNVGVLYYRALGTHQDLGEAAKWWYKAAVQGNANAQLCLGELYYAGGGVQKDETEALAWFMLSAAAGNNQAATQRDALARDLDTEQRRLAQERSKKIAQEIEAWRSLLPSEEKTKDTQK